MYTCRTSANQIFEKSRLHFNFNIAQQKSFNVLQSEILFSVGQNVWHDGERPASRSVWAMADRALHPTPCEGRKSAQERVWERGAL